MGELQPALPREHYVDEDAWQRERELILTREWLCAGSGRDGALRRGGGRAGSARQRGVLDRSRAGGTRVLGLDQFALGHVRGASHDSSGILRRSYHTPGYARLADAAYRDWATLEDEAGQPWSRSPAVRTSSLPTRPSHRTTTARAWRPPACRSPSAGSPPAGTHGQGGTGLGHPVSWLV